MRDRVPTSIFSKHNENWDQSKSFQLRTTTTDSMQFKYRIKYRVGFRKINFLSFLFHQTKNKKWVREHEWVGWEERENERSVLINSFYSFYIYFFPLSIHLIIFFSFSYSCTCKNIKECSKKWIVRASISLIGLVWPNIKAYNQILVGQTCWLTR